MNTHADRYDPIAIDTNLVYRRRPRDRRRLRARREHLDGDGFDAAGLVLRTARNRPEVVAGQAATDRRRSAARLRTTVTTRPGRTPPSMPAGSVVPFGSPGATNRRREAGRRADPSWSTSLRAGAPAPAA